VLLEHVRRLLRIQHLLLLLLFLALLLRVVLQQPHLPGVLQAVHQVQVPILLIVPQNKGVVVALNQALWVDVQVQASRLVLGHRGHVLVVIIVFTILPVLL